MFGRARAVFLALLVTQLAGCCCCCHRHCFHPFANRRCDGYASGDGCCSCYGPAPLAAAPVVPIPPATAAPPPASGTDGKIPSFNASIYGTSRVR